MEKAKAERIKEILLIGFVLAGVVLIALVWTHSLADRDPQSMGFYRGTAPVEDSFLITRTAEAALGTMPATREHKKEHATLTPGAEIQMTIIPPEEVDQEN